jgi:hypothetical protein
MLIPTGVTATKGAVLLQCCVQTSRRNRLSIHLPPPTDRGLREMRTEINAIAAALLVGREGNTVDGRDRSGIGGPYDATADKDVTWPRARREIARGAV